LRQFAYRLVGADAAKSHDVDDRLPCPAFNVIPAQLLIQATDLTRFAAVLKGKTVLIGADIPGIPDTFVSPVHGTLPGVFLHAMALDNLLALQTRYLKEMSGWIWVAIEISLVMLAAFAGAWRLPRAAPKPAYQALRSFAFTLCWSALGALAHAIDPQWGFVRVAVGGLIATYFVREEVIKAVFILVLICLVALISVELGWAPKNWMALAIAAVTAFGIAAHVAKQPAHASTHANAGTDVQSLYSTRTHTFTVTEVSRKVLRVLSPSRRRSTS
jgi:CHASE2 domain-containing sensor protein